MILTSDTLYHRYTHCYTFSSRYFIRLPCYGSHKESLRNLLKGRYSKIRKETQSFLYVTQCLNLIYIAIKFHYDIPMGYLVMGCAKLVLKNNQRDVTPKLSKGKQTFLYETRYLNLV